MSEGNNIYIRLKTTAGNLNSTFERLNKGVNRTTGSFSKFQKSNRKLNNSLSNLNKDANRSRQAIIGLGSAFGGLKKAMLGVNAYVLGRGIAQAVTANIEMIETINLYNNAMGMFAVSTNEALMSLSAMTGLDVTNLQNRVGTFNLLARSMGVSSEKSSVLSESINRLNLDLSSLTNTSIQQVAEDLRSGLIGQSRTMYKYGIDVTEAAIANEALAQGITKSVRNMTQGEKLVLRYIVMMKQAGISHGDFANTINTPANQLKVLKERFTTLSRTIGAIFIPILTKTLPYIQAMVITLTRLTGAIAKLVGYVATKKVENVNNDNFLGIPDDTEESIDDIGNALRKLQKQTMGFDEVNILADKSEVAGASTEDIGSPFDIEIPTLPNAFEGMRNSMETLADTMMEKLSSLVEKIEPVTIAFQKLWNEGLSLFGTFVWDNMLTFYNAFLVPLSQFTINDLLPAFFERLNETLKAIDWYTLANALTKLKEALLPFAKNVGEGLLWFFENVLSPIGMWVGNEVAPRFITLLTDTLGYLSDILEEFKPFGTWLWYDFIKPLGEWTGGIIINMLEKLSVELKDISKWIKENKPLIENLVLVIGGLILTWAALDKIMEVIISTFKILSPIIAFISHPIGLVVLAIGSLITIGVLLYKNWEKISEVASPIFEKIQELFSKTGEIFVNIWEKLLKPNLEKFMESIDFLWTKHFKPLWDELVKFFEALSLFATAFYNNFILPIVNYLVNRLSTGFNVTISFIMDLLSSYIAFIVDIVKSIVMAFTGIITFLGGVFTGDWGKMWDGISMIFKGVWEVIWSTVKYFINLIISAINSMIKALTNGLNFVIRMLNTISIDIPDWVPKYGGEKFGINIKEMVEYQIPKLERGGMVDSGQMFIAREKGAELVGQHNGKTGVMNNDQIVQSVSEGVYNAVTNAIKMSQVGRSGSGGRQELVLQLNGKEIGRGILPDINEEAKRNGFRPLLQYV